MRVDGAFAAVRPCGDLIQLCRFVAVADEDFLGGIEETRLRLQDPKLLFAQRLHDDCTH